MAELPIHMRGANYKESTITYGGEVAFTPFTLTRRRIIQEAMRWKRTPYKRGGNSRHGIDCSHFVWRVYSETVSSKINEHFFTSAENDHLFFNKISSAEAKQGDVICWGNEHCGIVVDPEKGTFIGAQCSTGVAEASYKHGCWAKQHYFLQYKHQMLRP